MNPDSCTTKIDTTLERSDHAIITVFSPILGRITATILPRRVEGIETDYDTYAQLFITLISEKYVTDVIKLGTDTFISNP